MKLPCEFGEYVLEELIGHGGMGDVYRGTRRRDGAVVAVKVIHPHLTRLRQFMERFHREAKLLEKLAHPRVVRLYDSGIIEREDDDEPTHYIAMECIAGARLNEVIEGKHTEMVTKEMTLSVKLDGKDKTIVMARGVIHMLRQIAAVLQEAHHLGIVHRDIKPDNIIVTNPNWDVKLLDFGIARDAEDLQRSISQTGNVLGTPPYMSPEQCKGDTDIDIRSDLYALGIVAYQCLTGVLPFSGPTTIAYIQQHIHMAPAPLRTVNPDLPESLSQVIERLLAKERDLRHQTPAELIEDLNRIERGWPPLKIYSFESRTLAETSPEGGERITPPTSDEYVLADATPAPAPGMVRRETPLPPRPPEQQKKGPWFVIPLLVVIAAAVVAAFFLVPILTGDKEKPKPEPKPNGEETATTDTPGTEKETPGREKEGPFIPVEEPWQAEWDRHVADGDKALGNNDYKNALESYNAALALHDDNDLRDKISRATERYELFRRQEQQRLKFLDLVGQGDKNFESGYYDEAIRIYEEALAIRHDDEVAQKVQQAKDKKREAEELIVREKEQARINIRRNLLQRMKKAEEALKAGDWNAAKAGYETALEQARKENDNSVEGEIQKQLGYIDSLVLLKTTMEAAEQAKNWPEMKQSAESLVKAGYSPAKEALEKVELKLRLADMRRTAEGAEQAGDYGAALDLVSQIRKLEDDPSLESWEARLRAKMGTKQKRQKLEDTIRKAQKALGENKPVSALEAAKEACAIDSTDERAKKLLRQSRVACEKWIVGTNLKKSAVKFEGRAATALAVGNGIVAVAAGPGSASPQGEASIFLVKDGGKKTLVEKAHSALVTGLAMYRDKLVSASFDGKLKVWDAKTGKLINEKDLGGQAWSLAVSGEYTAVGLKSGAVVLCETGTWKEEARATLGGEVRSLVLSADGKTLFVSSGASVYKLLVPDLSTASKYDVGATVRGIAPVADGMLAVADGKGHIHILTQKELRSERKWKAHKGVITALAQAAEGSVLASSSMEGTVCFWNAADGTELGRLKDAGWLVRELAVSESGIVAASETGGITVWQPE